MTAKDILTTYQIAQMCKVDITTVTNWIDAGKLQAYRTPGGHRRVEQGELKRFLKIYRMPMPPELKSNRNKILVVDDEEAIVEVIIRALAKSPWKFNFETAYDGFEAGMKIPVFSPNLVILDIHLPGVDGYKVLKDIRSNKEFKDIKVLAISGKNIGDNKNKILSCGADQFMEKPLDLPNMIKAVGTLLKLSLPQE